MTLRTLQRGTLLIVALFALSVAPLWAQSDTPTAMPEASTPTTFDNPDLVQQYQATITPEDLAAHLYVFASDYFEGRETATRGQKLAATYLGGQYRKMGLAPKGTVETDDPYAPEAYFQPFDLYSQRLINTTLDVTVNGETVASSSFGPDGADGAFYLRFGATPETEGSVVFAGYGIRDDALGYNDYAALEANAIDPSGKWLLVLHDEPLKNDSTSLLPTKDGTPSKWTTRWFNKLQVAGFGSDRSPAGILIVGDAGPHATNVAEDAARRAIEARDGVGRLSLEAPESNQNNTPPILYVTSDLANEILASTGRTIAEVQARINASLEPDVFEVPDVTLRTTIDQENVTRTSENVVAFIEGIDPVLKNEVIVLSSHYDHIGIDYAAEGDRINNGADDDGSGTVAVLEMAEAFMKAKQDGYGPRRSVLFLNVAGEEKGLLGSRYFTDTEPVVPLDQVVTNLNIDMIGRHDPTHPGDDPDYVYIIGSNLISQELHDINLRANEITGTNLDLHERFNSKDDPNQFYRRSDHWNFGKHSIPFIFFFTGTHEDYHGVDDEPEKIDYDRMARIARLIFATAWQVANQDAPPAVSGTGFN